MPIPGEEEEDPSWIETIPSIYKINPYQLLRIILTNDYLKANIMVWILSTLIFFAGALNLYFALTVTFPYEPSFFTSFLLIDLGFITSTLRILLGTFLIYLTFELVNRKFVAWVLTLALLTLSCSIDIIQLQFSPVILFSIAEITLLILSRGKFHVRSEISRMQDGLIFCCVMLVVLVSYGISGFLLLQNSDLNSTYTLSTALSATVKTIFFLEHEETLVITLLGQWFLSSLHVLSAITVLLSTFSLFRPIFYQYQLLPAEQQEAKAILDKHGNSSVDFFKLWPDKTYYFSKSRKSFIAYRVKYGVALSLGDPSGPVEELEELIKDFLQYCTKNGWQLAFHHSLPDLIPLYSKLGFSIFKIGEEASLDIDNFCEVTVKGGKFRRTMNKLTKAGYTVTIHTPPHPPELMQEIKSISDEWLLSGRRERSFTLGRFKQSYLQETPVITLENPQGRILAFLNQIRSYQKNAVTVDLMRHGKEIPNGAMDFLFASCILALKEEGYKQFSLGLAPFAGLSEDQDLNLTSKILRELIAYFDNVFSFRGLQYYKQKFNPAWEDRYLVYKGHLLSLLQVSIAVIRITEAGS
ncbi:MAG: bifunctional lysylphosphatidylglycerol flippase/synthetase MprF [Candidatus Hodarchaeales archaeon]|jgi:phosphatidylglycerol lysyltransferase